MQRDVGHAPLARLSGVAQALRRRRFASIWLAQICSSAAYASANFAIILLIQASQIPNTSLGLVLLANTIPAMLVAWPAGAVVDRLSKRSVLVTVMAVRAAALAVLLALQPTWPWAVALGTLIVAVLVYATVSQFYGLAEVALIPRLVGENLLIPANTIVSVCFFVGQFGGFAALGPWVDGLVGRSGLLTLDIGLLLVSTVLVALLPHDRPPPRPVGLAPRRLLAAVGHDLVDAMAAIRRDSVLVKALGYLSLASIVVMMLGTIGPVFATRILGGAAENLGLFATPPVLGGGVGLLLVNALAERANRERMIDRGILGVGLATLALALWPTTVAGLTSVIGVTPSAAVVLGVAAAIAAGLGCSLAFIMTPSLTLLQERPPATMVARVYAAYYSVASAAALLPTVLAGVLGDLLGVVAVLILIGLSLTALGALAMWRTGRVVVARALRDLE